MLRRLMTICMASAMIWGAAQKARADGQVEGKVQQLEHDLANAEIKGDSAAVERLEAADYVFTGPDGMVTGRQDDINDLKTGNFKVEAVDLDELKVRVYGDAAVVTGKATLKNCNYHGKDISGPYRYTDVWAEVNGKWQLVAGQASALAKMQ
jgi:ketosteroid isomerase-like protein